MTSPDRPRLSKSRFTAGVQCHKYLWWRVHEPDAVELQPDKVLKDLFNQGQEVGRRATELFPVGTLIDRDFRDYEGKVEDTKAALSDGAPSIYEASFRARNTFVAVDVLERDGDGFHLVEVKSSSSQKDEHIPDAAVQKYVLEECGVDVSRVSIMHLNKQHRFPSTGDLFDQTDVTTLVDDFISRVPDEIDRQVKMLSGDLPEVPIGAHCAEPRECPFLKRCWPQDRNHIKNLYNIGFKKVDAFLRKGVERISDLPATQKLNWTQKRQIKSMDQDQLVVEPRLGEALEAFDCKLGFLDFETIARAIPVWPGMGPWHQAAAQFSYHEDDPDGAEVGGDGRRYRHVEHLAEGPQDARPLLVERMLEATKDAERVVVYSSFEKTRIRAQQKSVPEYAEPLKELEGKLLDLLPIIGNNVYHPGFLGSFSLKDVLNPLVPELTYDDLVIVDGRVASVEIARLLFVAGKIPPAEVDRTRADLLAYCKQDTWATVKLLEKLRELAREF